MVKINLKNIKKRMNANFTLDIYDLEFLNNITGIVGNNGAGKTTLLSVICSLRKIDEGKIFVDNMDLTEKRLNWWKSIIGVYLDETFMFDYYSVIEHFKFIASLWNLTEVDLKFKINKYNQIFSLDEYMNSRISTLSTGNRKKVGLMATLLVTPKVLIWDEPFNGLDPKSQELLKNTLLSYKEEQDASILALS